MEPGYELLDRNVQGTHARAEQPSVHGSAWRIGKSRMVGQASMSAFRNCSWRVSQRACSAVLRRIGFEGIVAHAAFDRRLQYY
eukprot:998941-Pleurochrysis_carterae.AAC.2